MSLRHILLGMLRTPSSGYDVKKRFDASLRNFWKAELSQIYPALQKLESEGFVTSEQQDSDVGPRRIVYSRTLAGQDELSRWLESGPVIGNEKIGFLAQTFFLSEFGDNTAALGFVLRVREYYATQLAKLQARASEWSACDPDYPDDLSDNDFYAQLTLDCGLHRIAATVAWCDKTIARLENRDAATPRMSAP